MDKTVAKKKIYEAPYTKKTQVELERGYASQVLSSLLLILQASLQQNKMSIRILIQTMTFQIHLLGIDRCSLHTL